MRNHEDAKEDASNESKDRDEDVAGEDVGDIFAERTAQRVGRAIQTIQDEPAIDRFGWRTTISRSREGLGVKSDQVILTWNDNVQEWEASPSATRPTSEQRSVVVGDLVNTGRDIDRELGRAGSAVRRVLDDLEIDKVTRTKLEKKLKTLGSEIVDASAALTAITAALGEAEDTGIGQPSVSPLPPRLEEIARAVSIDLDSGFGGALPVRLHGSGSRSVASLQIQRVLYQRRLGKDGRALRPHPVSLIEEPEAHLHPQAQFDLARLLHNIPGQVVVSSHSAHLTSVLDPIALRILQGTPSELRVVDFKPDSTSTHRPRKPKFNIEGVAKLRRQVERPFGELLFAGAVVMGDGATERALLPPLIRHALGMRGYAVCVVDSAGMGGEFSMAVANFAKFVGIPWFLFADSDGSGRKEAERVDAQVGAGDGSTIVWVRTLSADGSSKGAATEKMLLEFDSDLCEEVATCIGYESDEDLFRFMQSKKSVMGPFFSEAIIRKYPRAEDLANWPTPIKELIELLDHALPRKQVPE